MSYLCEQMKSAIRYLVAIALSGGALYLAFRGQDIAMLQAELARTNVAALLAGTALQILAHLLRAWRWEYLLRPFKRSTSLWTGFKAVMVGYALNNVIPRSGEVARPLVLSSREHIPFSGTLGTIVLERVFDILIVGILLLISYLLYADILLQTFPEMIDSATTVVIVFAVGLIILIAAMLNPKIHRSIEAAITKLCPKKLGAAVNKLFTTFTDGLRGGNRQTAAPLIFGTTAIWLLYWSSMYAFLYSLPGSLGNVGIGGTTLLLTLSALAIAIPTPGGLGTYQYFISQSLMLVFGVPATSAIVFATISHFVPYIAVTVTGIFFAFREGVAFKFHIVNERHS